MSDSVNEHLAGLEKYLRQAIASQSRLTHDDIDAKEICAQLGEQLRLQQYRWADSKYLPHILTIHVPEDKAEKIEALEMIFCTPELARIVIDAANAMGIESLLPIRAEVELVKRDHPALIAGSNRCALSLTWPKVEDSLSLADITVDMASRRIVSIKVRRASMPVLARLTALNAEVYRNNYLLLREITHIGRLRVVLDDKTGRFVRRNDFVFAQNDDPEAICNSVSRQQAKIFYQADGSYYIEDDGSANTTRVERAVDTNKKEFVDVRKGTPVRLTNGDILHFGLAQVRFQLVDHIDPTVLAEIGTEQERASARRQGEKPQNVTMKLPTVNRKDL